MDTHVRRRMSGFGRDRDRMVTARDAFLAAKRLARCPTKRAVTYSRVPGSPLSNRDERAALRTASECERRSAPGRESGPGRGPAGHPQPTGSSEHGAAGVSPSTRPVVPVSSSSQQQHLHASEPASQHDSRAATLAPLDFSDPLRAEEASGATAIATVTTRIKMRRGHHTTHYRGRRGERFVT